MCVNPSLQIVLSCLGKSLSIFFFYLFCQEKTQNNLLKDLCIQQEAVGLPKIIIGVPELERARKH